MYVRIAVCNYTLHVDNIILRVEAIIKTHYVYNNNVLYFCV